MRHFTSFSWLRPVWCAVIAAKSLAMASLAAEPAPVDFARAIRPVLGKYCLDCHSTARHKGDLDLEVFGSTAEVARQPRVWQGVVEQVATGEMPPKDKPQPGSAEREQFLADIGAMLDAIARERAGDPGPVVLRRLSNAEYTYTVRDLTGVDSLDPAREFPVDGAAGEGFMNAGSGLVMSPTLLTKYLDAARGIAEHAVLLPDGLRFSASTSRRDWTDEIVGRIRGLYREFTDPRGATKVNLQGLTWETNEGGRIPLERYWAVLREARAGLGAGSETIEGLAARHGLSPKYLGRLWTMIRAAPGSGVAEDSLLFDSLRVRWGAAEAGAGEAEALTAEVARWQKALWKFSSVGHIGKVGGPKAWMEPVVPLMARQDVRLKLVPAAGADEVRVRLVANDAGDGAAGDRLVWENPRLLAPGRPPLALRDVRAVVAELRAIGEQVRSTTAKALDAVASVEVGGQAATAEAVTALARERGVEPRVLQGWLAYLGVGAQGPAPLTGHMKGTLASVGGFDFVRGWGSPDTPNLVANASDRAVRVPGNLKPHGVAVHPSPTLQAAVAWRSPVTESVRVSATVTHAHPECGNGVEWTLELRRGNTRQRLAAGISQGGKPVDAGTFEKIEVRTGDAIVLRVGPRDGSHACDLTALDFEVRATGDANRRWNLSDDVSGDVQAGNPHADRLGNEAVWHFVTESVASDGDTGVVIPPGSILARWRSGGEPEARRALAREVEQLVRGEGPAAKDGPDAALFRQLTAWGGPLLQACLAVRAAGETARPSVGKEEDERWGLAAARFGREGEAGDVAPGDLVQVAPSVVEVRLPAALVEGGELVTSGRLSASAEGQGSVQAVVLVGDGAAPTALTSDLPVVVADGSAGRRRWERSMEAYRELFPAALAYVRIVPVDEVVTLTLFHREDEALRRLMLNDAQVARLDRLWDELRFVSQDALTLVDAYAQLMEYATQDADPKVFEPLRRPIQERAAAFRRALVTAEPAQVAAAIDFVARAYRRQLAAAESDELRGLYDRLRAQDLPHDEAVRMMLARALVSPAFLYRVEKPAPGVRQAPVNDWELASRVSYFLWSGPPDERLRELAAAGRLHEPEVLGGEVRRMLKDTRVRRLAVEFGCQWLHVHGFDELDEKSERHFPTFAGLRGAMYEESIRFFTEFFHADGAVPELLTADHTFVNGALAAHYGIPGVEGDGWRRVEGVRAYGRGGILGLATTLAKQSGASRTSPILRGNWISEVLVGEKLPRPPKDVPRLPEDEAATDGLTVRQLVEKHSQDPRCAGCHARIDPYGFALEGYDAIGRRRTRDLADRPIDVHAKAADGAEFNGLDGLRDYLTTRRREAFLRQFCRKLLGYALGRGVQLSDGPLLDSLRTRAGDGTTRVAGLIEAIVLSRQFREIRGQDHVDEAGGG